MYVRISAARTAISECRRREQVPEVVSRGNGGGTRLCVYEYRVGSGDFGNARPSSGTSGRDRDDGVYGRESRNRRCSCGY